MATNQTQRSDLRRSALRRPAPVRLTPVSPPPKKKSAWTGFRGKTLWDLLNLMAVLLVPLMIGVFTLAITIQQNQISQNQHESDQRIADEQQQATTLKAYLDDMTDLMLNHGLRQSKSDEEVRIVARAKTLTALRGLNGDRKGTLIRFLSEAKLIGTKETGAIISLDGADLSKANLGGTLVGKEYSVGAGLDLMGASLSGANLQGANLFAVNLSGDDLSGADLSGADLTDADLRGANLECTILSPANLNLMQGADLSGADFICPRPEP